MNTKFRLEKRATKGGDKYYLVYPVITPKRKTKISRLIKTGDVPTDAEFETAVLQYTEEFTKRAADKYAEFRVEELYFQYIPPFLGNDLRKPAISSIPMSRLSLIPSVRISRSSMMQNISQELPPLRRYLPHQAN